MAREITMDELLRKQREMSDKAQSMASEKDVDRIQAITAELEQEGRDLEKLAKDFERQELAKAGPPPRGKLEVVLTPGQRERVKKMTGVELTSVVVGDEMGVLSKAMPSTDPRDIELIAINEARKLAAHKDADVKMRAALADAVDEIEKTGFGEVVQMLDQLKADPNWMGGLFQKNKK
ncbi:MAG: hypothetical protein JWN44_2731 [Myxococcales bacterium]|nr:hypothetical protein [Myxococcales bacterium]